MMGKRTVSQEALFGSFSLEEHVPENHMLSWLDRFLDLSGIRGHLKPSTVKRAVPRSRLTARSGY